MNFARVKQSRDQQVLFPERLDEAVDADHDVRLVDKILHSIDFTAWESKYDLVKGQPPIHPRVIAGVILYGLLCRCVATISFPGWRQLEVPVDDCVG